jgi:hypothetical protein
MNTGTAAVVPQRHPEQKASLRSGDAVELSIAGPGPQLQIMAWGKARSLR